MLINSKQHLFIMNGIKSILVTNKDAAEQRILMERKES